MKEEEGAVRKGFEMKCDMQQGEKVEYIKK